MGGEGRHAAHENCSHNKEIGNLDRVKGGALNTDIKNNSILNIGSVNSVVVGSSTWSHVKNGIQDHMSKRGSPNFTPFDAVFQL